MAAQAPAPDAGEFHPISIRLDEDFTEDTCAVCGPLEHVGAGLEGCVAHGADHTLVTGHTVTERHVVVSTIRECA